MRKLWEKSFTQVLQFPQKEHRPSSDMFHLKIHSALPAVQSPAFCPSRWDQDPTGDVVQVCYTRVLVKWNGGEYLWGKKRSLDQPHITNCPVHLISFRCLQYMQAAGLWECAQMAEFRHWQEGNGGGQHVNDGGSVAQCILSPWLSHHHGGEMWMLPMAAQEGNGDPVTLDLC